MIIRTTELSNGYTGKTITLVPISIITGTKHKREVKQ